MDRSTVCDVLHVNSIDGGLLLAVMKWICGTFCEMELAQLGAV